MTGADTSERAGDRIHQILRRRILMGEISAGERLSVPALARELEVSRSPVREAVLRLCREGLAQEERNRGAVVPHPDTGTLISLYQAREALEGMTARLAAENFSADIRRRLLSILTEHEEVVAEGDFTRHIEMDAAFHRNVREAAGSPVMAKMLDEIQGQVMLAMRSTAVSGGARQAIEDHRRIFEALATGDPEVSERAARQHIARLIDLLRQGAFASS